MKKLKLRCIVKGCTNRRPEGAFEGEVCLPCHMTLVKAVKIVRRMRNNPEVVELIRRLTEEVR
jgi:hypothetical protein